MTAVASSAVGRGDPRTRSIGCAAGRQVPDAPAGDGGAASVSPGSLADRVDAIVIGASAGGIEALMTLLPRLAADLPVPIHVVVHVPRDRPSLLATVFAHRCAMRVVEAEDKMPVEPGTIHFAPPDYHLLVDRGPILALSIEAPVKHSRPSIDVLFESAAQVHGPRLAAILLTGASDDGTDGLVAVRRAGGIVVVQEPASAASPIMPTAALRRVAADHVLPLAGIGALLRTLEGVATNGETR